MELWGSDRHWPVVPGEVAKTQTSSQHRSQGAGHLGATVEEVRGVGQIRQHGSHPLHCLVAGTAKRPSSNAPLALPTLFHSYSSDRHRDQACAWCA